MDHLRAALASEPSGRDLLAAAEQPRKAQPYPQPSGPLRDRRWFVLRDTALAWYNTDDDHTLQAPPKVPPRSLRQPRPPPDRPPPPGPQSPHRTTRIRTYHLSQSTQLQYCYSPPSEITE